MSSWIACALALVALMAASPVHAAKRVALVIGNDAYGTLPDLNNARADARGMAAKLKSMGFEVILKLDASRRDFGRAVTDFEGRLASAEVGLVFYAGHGIQANGRNWLIPSNAEIEAEEDLEFEGIDSNRLLESMKRAGSPLNIVILDACRDNPLPKRSRSAARGLAIAHVPTGIKGTAIVYSAAPGADGRGRRPGRQRCLHGGAARGPRRAGSEAGGRVQEDGRARRPPHGRQAEAVDQLVGDGGLLLPAGRPGGGTGADHRRRRQGDAVLAVDPGERRSDHVRGLSGAVPQRRLRVLGPGQG